MCINTLVRTHKVNVNNAFSYGNNVHFEGDKIPF